MMEWCFAVTVPAWQDFLKLAIILLVFYTSACKKHQRKFPVLHYPTNGCSLQRQFQKCVDFRLSKVEKCKSIIEPPKPRKASSKAISKLNLRELTEDQQEDFYRKLSLLKHKPVVLAVHHKYNDPFKPKSTTRQSPLPIRSFYDKNKVNLSLEELIALGISIKDSYRIIDNDAMNLEEFTRLQSKCHLWGIHQAGRITASNMKSVLCTSCDKPSLSLIKKLCYPEVYKFSNA